MSHLTLEALARLLDEAPTGTERAHLGACAPCRDELAALRGQTAALAALPRMMPAPDAWPELRERLMEERLVQPAAGRRRIGPAARAAAAIVLFVGGGALGYAMRGEAAAPAGTALAQEPPPRAADPAGEAAEPGLQQVEAAQEAFLTALDRYMAATGSSGSDPAARLATLDNIVLTTAEALHEAPADPVINSFHLTALAQRNAMLRQIATSSEPVF
ncbi:MAG TPA: hypothetical protein VMM12_15370 [Longimicrobiales bacterium]|nr:hypothetical protein [Longimicrobiales bacterium]